MAGYGYGGYGDKPRAKTDNRDNRGNRENRPEATLPSDYLVNGYTDNTGVLDIKYITEYAESIGRDLGNDRKTGVSKIRSYYDEVISDLTDCTYSDIQWTSVRNRVAMLKARANNRVTKGTASKLFFNFISKNVDTVVRSKTEAEFKENLANFKDHFEAVVCYLPKK